MFTRVSRVVPEYESSRMMISAQMCTRQRVVVVRHSVTVLFLTPFFLCAECRGDLISSTEDPTVVGKFSAIYVKLYIPFLKNACAFVLPFRGGGALA